MSFKVNNVIDLCPRIQVFRGVMPCHWVIGSQPFDGSWCLHLLDCFTYENEGTMILWKS